jgi:hypothetical protein
MVEHGCVLQCEPVRVGGHDMMLRSTMLQALHCGQPGVPGRTGRWQSVQDM